MPGFSLKLDQNMVDEERSKLQITAWKSLSALDRAFVRAPTGARVAPPKRYFTELTAPPILSGRVQKKAIKVAKQVDTDMSVVVDVDEPVHSRDVITELTARIAASIATPVQWELLKERGREHATNLLERAKAHRGRVALAVVSIGGVACLAL